METTAEKIKRERAEMKARIQAMTIDELIQHPKTIIAKIKETFEKGETFMTAKSARDKQLKALSVEGFKGSNKYIKFKFKHTALGL